MEDGTLKVSLLTGEERDRQTRVFTGDSRSRARDEIVVTGNGRDVLDPTVLEVQKRGGKDKQFRLHLVQGPKVREGEVDAVRTAALRLLGGEGRVNFADGARVAGSSKRPHAGNTDLSGRSTDEYWFMDDRGPEGPKD